MKKQDVEAAEKVYELAIELRNFEISQLFQRNNFFMVTQGILLAAITQSANSIPIVSFIMCIAGLLLSVLQILMACGAKYWQDRWEIGAENAEKILERLLNNEEERKIFIEVMGKPSNRIELKQRIRFLRSGLKRGKLPTWRKYTLPYYLVFLKPSVSRIPIYMAIMFVIIWLSLLSCTINFGVDIPKFIVGFPK
ncbi:MAG: hypothetical protein E6Z82_05530 [Neisseria sp.]|jgi:hypothetical protein|nr:hypothetical protein [Neisseria sp.]